VCYATQKDVDDKQPQRSEVKCEVIAGDAVQAFTAVMAKHEGMDVTTATIERIAVLDAAMKV
jgi:hypothetical protein